MPVLNVRNNLIFPAVLFDSGVQSRVNSLGMPFLGMSDGDRLHQALGIGHQLFRLLFVEGDYREVKSALVRHVIHEQVAVGGGECGLSYEFSPLKCDCCLALGWVP